MSQTMDYNKFPDPYENSLGAKAVLSEDERIIFSEQAFREFVTVLSQEKPEPPSEKLLQAVARYKSHDPVTVAINQ